jgi:DnaJ homolog subfamily B member 12
MFDRHGLDPDSRTAGMPESPFGNGFGGMRREHGGGVYGDEISPDDLFNMFFGGGGFGGGGFNNGILLLFCSDIGPFGPGFQTQFGGPGIRVHRFGGGRPRRQAAAQQQGNSSVLYQLLPVLLLLAFTVIPALFGGSTPSTPSPSFVFETAKPPYTLQRSTPQHGISYFLNPSEIQSLSTSKLRQLDQKAEVTFVRGLRDQCQLEHDVRQQKLANAQGWFGQIKDQNAYDEARTMRLSNCERLRAMGYRPEIY